ncbi:plastocyanin/azurin family copper-binding protein [Glaciimonas sp. PAMC28666]|uniref:cupredoxin domain-containing protein n=1 Tax=Glaciimonas sp. PAMC28666 TaxID=2807626 RepID=UPI00196409A6|nr:cupredoxin family protein [Glaciimonas sp. PAMC28666]QRX83393.1 cupredoxin family protein [Glaciimonas sp. PAMC28666]
MKRNFLPSLLLSSIVCAFTISTLTIPSLSHADTQHRQTTDTDTAGSPGKAGAASRTIHIEMADDMRFTPSDVTVKQGETIKFVVANKGKLVHEMVIGNAAELAEHAQLMRKMPDMKHEEANQITVEPGKTANLIWKFSKAMKVDFACLEPGHFEAGMKGKVNVIVSK